MAIIVVLAIIFAVVFGIAAGLTILSNLASIGSRRDDRVKSLKAELVAERLCSNISVKALRRIADPSCGRPDYEAQNALDEINNIEMKELG